MNNFRELFRWPLRRDGASVINSVPDSQETFGLHVLYPEENSAAAQLQAIDIVAVHGLGGHAMGTWTHSSTGKLWLKDFLPLDIPNARIMTFGYDSKVVDSRNILGMMENANNLLTHLRNYRNSRDLETRPLIFIGHSLGGLIIKKALIMAGEADAHRQILNATHTVMFMGVPHDGTDAATLANRVVKVAKLFFNLNRATLKVLRRDSRQLQDVSLSFSYLEGFDIITVMESERTRFPGTTKSRLIVPQTSALLNLGNREEWFNIAGADHHGVCKFASEDNAGYKMVCEGLRKQVAKLPYPVTTEMLLSVVGEVGCDQLLRHLPAVGLQDPKPHPQPSSHGSPRPYWIFKNMDFEQWQSTNCSEVLWISGPAGCRISDASLRIVNLLAKKASSEVEHSVLYFFCSTAPKNVSIAITFISTVIHQLVCSLPRLKEEITTVFLRTLLDTILKEELLTNQELSRFKRDDSLEATVKKILKASSDGYWSALRAVMNIDREHGLSLIVDGLERTEYQKYEFIRELYTFIEDLQERPTPTRVLLTSRPQAVIKAILSGLPCIEYDRERKECLSSLRFDNTRYENISEQHKGSLEWLWEHEEYCAWSSTDSSDLLLIEGKPGSGKSTLMKYFQCSLMEKKPRERPIIASFYYSYREGEQQTNHSNMLRSVLHDVLNQNEEFFFHFQPYYRQATKRGGQFRWSYDSLRKILLSFTKNHPAKERLYLIVDAVDESDDRERYDIIELLRELCATNGPCIVKVFVASRPVAGLSGQSAKPEKNQKMIKLQDVNNSDIIGFANSFLGTEFDLSPEISREATNYIVRNAEGVFVWVRLVREELRKYMIRGCIKDEIFDFLKSLPTELEGFYEHILKHLERGETRDVQTGRRMLQFVLFAFRPLRLEELRQALAIRESLDATFTYSDESFEKKLILGIENRIICCAGNLLEIKGSDENKIVQVMHQTVPEFFRPSGPTAQTKFPMHSESGHRRIAITCIQYLMLCSVNTSLVDQLPDIHSWTPEHFEAYVRYLHERPFIIYALSYLEKHINTSGEDTQISGLLLLFREKLTSSKNPFSYIFGELVARVAPNRQDSSGNAKEIKKLLLHTATRMQYSRVVEALLVAGAEVEARQDGKTALIVAAEGGDHATVQILLEQGAFAGATDSINQTALHLAASNGHTAAVRLLIDQGAEMEAEDNEKWRGLHFAAASGHDAVVELLIDRGADKEAEDNEKRRGLHLAAGNGHNAVVNLLIERGADKEAIDILGWQALHTAAWNGHKDTIQMLVQDLGASKDAKDTSGWTALHVAAMSGQDATIQMLVENLGADKEAKDNDGWTALHFVAVLGLKDTTRLLVKTIKVDRMAKNEKTQTALKLAQEL